MTEEQLRAKMLREVLEHLAAHVHERLPQGVRIELDVSGDDICAVVSLSSLTNKKGPRGYIPYGAIIRVTVGSKDTRVLEEGVASYRIAWEDRVTKHFDEQVAVFRSLGLLPAA